MTTTHADYGRDAVAADCSRHLSNPSGTSPFADQTTRLCNAAKHPLGVTAQCLGGKPWSVLRISLIYVIPQGHAVDAGQAFSTLNCIGHNSADAYVLAYSLCPHGGLQLARWSTAKVGRREQRVTTGRNALLDLC